MYVFNRALLSVAEGLTMKGINKVLLSKADAA
jgi:hypothetical protein